MGTHGPPTAEKRLWVGTGQASQWGEEVQGMLGQASNGICVPSQLIAWRHGTGQGHNRFFIWAAGISSEGSLWYQHPEFKEGEMGLPRDTLTAHYGLAALRT